MLNTTWGSNSNQGLYLDGTSLFISENNINLRLCGILKKERKIKISIPFDEVYTNNQKVTVETISKELDEMLSQCVFEMMEVAEVVEVLNSFLNDSDMGARVIQSNFVSVIKFYADSLTMFIQNLRLELDVIDEMQLTKILHSLLKSLIAVIDKSFSFDNIDNKNFETLYRCIRNLLICDKLALETIYNCGLLLVMIDYNYLKITSTIWLLKNSQKIDPLKYLALCYGFLVTVPVEILSRSSRKIDGTHSMLVAIVDSLFCIHSKYLNDSKLLSGILKNLLIFTQRICLTKHNIPSRLLKTLLLFLWTQLDHFLDVIKNLSRECLTNVISQKDKDINHEIMNLIRSYHEIDRKMCTLLCCISTFINEDLILFYYEKLIEDLINAGKCSVSGSYIVRTYTSLMISSYQNSNFEKWFELWIKPLFSVGNEFHHFTEPIFKSALKLCPPILQKLQQLANETKNYQLLMKCFLTLKNYDFTGDQEKMYSEISVEYLFQNKDILTALLKEMICIPNSEAANIISLMLESYKANHNINDEQVELFKIYINNNLNNLDTSQRQKFLSLVKKIFVVVHRICNHEKETLNYKIWDDFLTWTLRRCFNGLFIGASFPRRQTALRILEILLDICLWTTKNSSVDEIRNVLLFLTDSYEKNKQLTVKLILPLALDNNYFTKNEIKSLYRVMVDMILNANFCEHSTAAHLLQFVCSYQDPVTVHYLFSIFLKHIIEYNEEFQTIVDHLEKSGSNSPYYIYLSALLNVLQMRLELVEDSRLANKPLYGLLHAMRHLLGCMEIKNFSLNEEWKQLVTNIAITCIDCNSKVISVVSQSSPEGYLPEEELTNISDDFICYTNSQRILVYSWRTIKEASLLLGFLCEKFAIVSSDQQNVFIEKNLFLNIGKHLKSLLFEMKHKGAVEQVYKAMRQFCHCCWRCSDDTIKVLPKQWLKETIERILTNSTDLCTTRRSAGIPYIVLAILSTEYDGVRKWNSDFFDLFMKSIMEICDNIDRNIYSKMHSMNVLRMIFKNKDFTNVIDGYIEKNIQLSIAGVRSSFWNIRNVSWLLLGSVINRIFGTASKNRMSGKTFFGKYPLLFEVFVSCLRDGKRSEINLQSPLYVILFIFSKFNVSTEYDRSGDIFPLKLFIPLIFECSQSPIWKIRQTAAFALLPLITPDIFVYYVNLIWHQIRLCTSENAAHGFLLQLEVLLGNDTIIKEELRITVTKILNESAEILNSDKHSFVVKQQLLTIMTLIIKLDPFDIHKSRPNYISCKQYSLSHKVVKAPNQIAQNEYIKNKSIFHICLLHYLGINIDAITKVQAMEDVKKFIENEILSMPFPGESSNKCIVLEFFYNILSKDDDVDDSNILQNEIIRLVVKTYPNKATLIRNCILNSREIYIYVSDTVKESQSDCFDSIELVLAFHILFYFVRKTFTRCLEINVIFKICDKYPKNQCTLLSLIKYMDARFAHENFSTLNDRISIMKMLFKLSSTPSSNFCDRELALFHFKYRHIVFSCNDDVSWVLDICTFILKYADVSQDFELLRLSGGNYVDEFPLINALINEFYDCLRTKPQICAVALTSWILGDVGREWEEICETNPIFTENVSEGFEDYFIISKISSALLQSLIASKPDLLQQALNEESLQWMVKYCSLEKEKENIICLNDLVQIISRKYSVLVRSVDESFSFLRAKTLKKHFSLNKMSLILNM